MDSYCIAYLIDGRFGTYTGFQFLNDIVARFSLTLPITERLKHPPREEDKQHDHIYKLKAFQNLKSMATGRYKPTMKGTDHKGDTFWELKLWVEYSIKNNGGEGNYVEFDLLLDHALHYYEWKDKSTCRAKCRNIWNWYERRSWAYHVLKRSSKTEKEILMTRQERARSNAEAKAEKARKAVITAITGLYADEYKKKSGAWHYIKLSEATGLSRRVVAKYVKQWEANKDGMFEELK